MIGKQFLRKSSYSFSFLQWLCSLCRFISVVICFLKTYSSYKSCLVILNCSQHLSPANANQPLAFQSINPSTPLRMNEG